MILLDGLDKHSDPQPPKLVAESSVPVARAHTPTPSLPDYEASQAQLKPTTLSYPQIKEKRTRRRRWRKCALYSLVVYFFLTIAIGVPLIVVKLKRKAYTKANPYDAWSGNPPIPPKSITLGDAPLRLSSAKSCNAWNVEDQPDGPLLRSELQYNVPVNGSIFLNTNITYSGNGTYLSHFSGQLLVGVSDDPTADEAAVHVTMHHTTSALRNATNVCLMQTGQGGGVYLFSDSLSFNITLLLPQNHTSTRHVPQLMCHLPNFKQTYQQIDPYVTFGSVVLGGAMSEVSIKSIQASTAVVKASLAEIEGRFAVDSSLSLETVSAPINADIHLYNYGTSDSPTYLHLTTGNSVLNANVTMYVPPGIDPDFGPHFLGHAETFNAPLTLALMHDEASVPATLRLRALNNLGNTRVSVDSRYEGTFDVATMFAQADVVTQHGTESQDYHSNGGNDDGSDEYGSGADAASDMMNFDDDDDDDVVDYGSDDYVTRGKVRMYLPSVLSTGGTSTYSAATTSASSEGNASGSTNRCLEYDLISSSEIRGWVGTPPRPSPTSGVAEWEQYDSMGHIDIVSSLSGAQLVLLT
ncbi:hypothetical protein C8Q73DRAFT_746417 [Cubamyces lactineus]|nr:hypothetical protein C8Q73DRAFT_746417 [Cubamyces lactineus]